MLLFVPDHFKTQEMCNKAMEKDPWLLGDVPDCFKTQEMCIRALEVDPWQQSDFPYHLEKKGCVKKRLKIN